MKGYVQIGYTPSGEYVGTGGKPSGDWEQDDHYSDEPRRLACIHCGQPVEIVARCSNVCRSCDERGSR